MINNNVFIKIICCVFLTSCLLVASCNDDDGATDDTTSVRLSLLDSVETDGRNWSVLKDGDYVYVANRDLGLLTYDVSDNSFSQIASLDLQSYSDADGSAEPLYLAKSGDYLYMSAYQKGLFTIDVSNPANPFIASPPYDTPVIAQGVTIAGDKLYLCDDSSFMIFDISFGASPQLLGQDDQGMWTGYISSTVEDDFAFVAQYPYGFALYDVVNPASPRYLTSIPGIGTNYWSTAKAGDYLLLGGGGTGLLVYDTQASKNILSASLPTSDIENPTPDDQTAYQIQIQDHYAYIADGNNGIVVVNILDASSPHLVEKMQTGDEVMGISVEDDLLVAVDKIKGVYLFRISQVELGADIEGDGIANEDDLDDDGDGRTDVTDLRPLDTDNDGLMNASDPDDDNDGVIDEADVFPLDEEEWEDLNGDGLGDNFPNNRYAVIQVRNADDTISGNIKLELFEDLAPLTTKNFIRLAQSGFYDGLIFHRVIDGFMNQGGDPDGVGTGGPDYAILDEFPTDENGDLQLTHDSAGILSMANSGPNTGGSQFFITLDQTSWLDGAHSVFGNVVEGLDVVQDIGATPTDVYDRPLTDVIMESVTITTE